MESGNNKIKGAVRLLLNALVLSLVLSNPRGNRKIMRELLRRISKKNAEEKRISKKEAITLSQMLYYLKRRKFIKIQRIDGKTIISLTEKGKRRKLSYDFGDIKISKPEIWDEKWRLVVFDIPEKYKIARQSLRRKLGQMGFLQFQKSVWLYPYSCDNEIDFISEYFSVAKYINLLTASIENDRRLRRHFSL